MGSAGPFPGHHPRARLPSWHSGAGGADGRGVSGHRGHRGIIVRIEALGGRGVTPAGGRLWVQAEAQGTLRPLLGRLHWRAGGQHLLPGWPGAPARSRGYWGRGAAGGRARPSAGTDEADQSSGFMSCRGTGRNGPAGVWGGRGAPGTPAEGWAEGGRRPGRTCRCRCWSRTGLGGRLSPLTDQTARPSPVHPPAPQPPAGLQSGPPRNPSLPPLQTLPPRAHLQVCPSRPAGQQMSQLIPQGRRPPPPAPPPQGRAWPGPMLTAGRPAASSLRVLGPSAPTGGSGLEGRTVQPCSPCCVPRGGGGLSL